MSRWIALALIACDGGGPGQKASPDLVFLDENNFEYKAEVDIQSVDVAARTDFCGFWDQMTTDLRERPLVPGEVEQAALLEFDLTQAEVAEKVANNTLKQADAATLWQWENTGGDTTVCASSFEIIGSILDPEADQPLEENASQSWLFSLLKVPDGVNDVLTSLFVVPSDASSNDVLTFTDTSSILNVTTLEIASKPPIPTVAGADAYTLNWEEVTNDVNGQPYDPLLGDILAVARFDVADATGIEELFLRLDTEAAEYYKMSVFGETEAVLSDLEPSDDGGTFGGFTTDGVWLVAISCSSCTSPVPLLLATVSVEAE